MKFSEACDTYFGSKDLYKIFSIDKYASSKEVRKAYYRLSLSFHPDRVCDVHKSEAAEKFKVISKIHEILSDPNQRAIYDETGVWNDEDDAGFEGKDWMGYWRTFYSRVTDADIKQYEEDYKGSDQELNDLKATYKRCKGDMGKMFQYIMFYSVEDEERIRGRIMDLIKDGTLPEYDIFMNEPQAQRDRRFRMMRKEAKLAEKELKKMEEEKQSNGFEDLQKAILARRQQNSDSFLDALEKKYSSDTEKKGAKEKKGGKAKKDSKAKK